MGDYVVDPYQHAKFHKDTITPFRPPNTRKFASSDSASFFLVLPSAYSQDPCTDFHDQYVNILDLANDFAKTSLFADDVCEVKW